jgi:hypothetical protein
MISAVPEAVIDSWKISNLFLFSRLEAAAAWVVESFNMLAQGDQMTEKCNSYAKRFFANQPPHPSFFNHRSATESKMNKKASSRMYVRQSGDPVLA